MQRLSSLLVLLLALALVGCGAPAKAVKLVVTGDERELRKRAENSPPSSPDGGAPILLIALDGMSRGLLYDLLAQGKAPHLAALLGGAAGGKLPHAHLYEKMLSTLPSSTMAAWVTTMTGVPPSEHGVTGNEYFVRETRTFACPAPVSFSSAEPTLAIYSDSYLDSLFETPTVYERLRAKEPNLLAWVALHNVHRGADKLLLAKRTVFASAFEGFIEDKVKKLLEDKQSRRLYAELDEAAVSVVIDQLEGNKPVPDVLTLYLPGTDMYAHVAYEGPDHGRSRYVVDVLEPQFERLANKLRERNALADRWVVVVSDHGHTQIPHDEEHALATDEKTDPPAVLRSVGFRVRPFSREVDKDDPFSAVLAYGGAMAYVYLADRSSCAGEKDVCDWTRPPRYQEDVLAAADAFFRNDDDGSLVPAMRATLDMVLTRKPKPFRENDDPFEVYVGAGRTMPIDAYLAQHPHPTYIAFDARLRDLAAGRYGERAGDVLLLARNGAEPDPTRRYYFASPYHSWHGSPSKLDSEIPLIVAHPTAPMNMVAPYVERTMGARPFQQKVTDILLGLRQRAWDRR